MKTKLKIALSCWMLFLYLVSAWVYRLFEPAISGNANAKLLNDSVADYGTFRAVSSDAVPTLLKFILLFALLLIWIPLFTSKKQK